MLYQITQFLLDVAVSLLAGASLLRLYMQWARAPFRNPLGQFVMVMSSWLVLPLRRVLPALGRLDTASLVAAFLLVLVKVVMLWLLTGAREGWLVLFAAAAFELLQLVVTGLTVLVIVNAVLSWVPTRSAIDGVMEVLCEPLLAPWRRVLPRPGGFDLSPLVALVLLQVITIVLQSAHATVLPLL